MRTGAIFVRGSCRALKWVALVGMVFVLGVGQAFAQIGIKSVSVDEARSGMVDEGALLTFTVTLNERVPKSDGAAGTVVITLEEVAATNGAVGTKGNAETGDVSLPITSIVIPEQKDSGSARFVTGADVDAVNERFQITATAAAGSSGSDHITITTETTGGSRVSRTYTGTIKDSETQDYVLRLSTPQRDVKETHPSA